MIFIKHNLDTKYEAIEIHVFADLHIGDAECDTDAIKQRIETVRSTPNAYCVLNGDIIDNASRSSIGDIETRQYNIMEQLNIAVDLFEPIKDKILCIVTGNHEYRAMKKEGIDLTQVLATALGCADKYSPDCCLLSISHGHLGNGAPCRHPERPKITTVFCTHGSGGGRKAGGKVNNMMQMAETVDADLYIHSHTHMPAVVKDSFLRVDHANRTFKIVDRTFVNNGATMDFGGYGSMMGFQPASKASPVIVLHSRHDRGIEVRVE